MFLKTLRKALTLILVLGASSTTKAADWFEVGDAGHLLGTAQSTLATTPLTGIQGVLDSGDVDLYQIYVADWSLFSATTIDPITPGPSPLVLDTQLFLFDSSGLGIAMNDDTDLTDLRSTLPVGDPWYSGLTPGTYYLGISTLDLDPQTTLGEVWLAGAGPLGLVEAPNGPGALDPLSGWSGTDSAGGDSYRIALTGVGATLSAPEPISLIFMFIGSTLGYRLRRRAC